MTKVTVRDLALVDVASEDWVLTGSASDGVIKKVERTSLQTKVALSEPHLVGTISPVDGSYEISTTGLITLDDVPIERRSEALYENLNIKISHHGSDGVNLLDALYAYTPTSGGLFPFFNGVSGKLNAYNMDASLTLKINILGKFRGGSSRRSLALNLLGTVGNAIVLNRPEETPSDVFSFNTTVMISENGGIVRNGAPLHIYAGGSDFEIDTILLAAVQRVLPTTPLSTI